MEDDKEAMFSNCLTISAAATWDLPLRHNRLFLASCPLVPESPQRTLYSTECHWPTNDDDKLASAEVSGCREKDMEHYHPFQGKGNHSNRLRSSRQEHQRKPRSPSDPFIFDDKDATIQLTGLIQAHADNPILAFTTDTLRGKCWPNSDIDRERPRLQTSKPRSKSIAQDGATKILYRSRMPEARPKRKRHITTDQRKAANIRERRRMSNLNDAFELLRKLVPTFTYERKPSRVETIRLAAKYIKCLIDILQ